MNQTFKVTGSAEDKRKFIEELKGMGWKPFTQTSDKGILQFNMGVTPDVYCIKEYMSTAMVKDITYTLPTDHDAALQAFREWGEPELKMPTESWPLGKACPPDFNASPTDSGVKAAEEWISVKDRMPEPKIDVLVLTNEKWGNKMVVAKLDTVFKKEFVFCATCITDVVTHWMPLPKAPAFLTSKNDKT